MFYKIYYSMFFSAKDLNVLCLLNMKIRSNIIFIRFNQLHYLVVSTKLSKSNSI